MANQIHTAASELSVIVPEIWSQRYYDVLLAELPFNAIVSRDYEGEIQNLGDTVKISTFPEFASTLEPLPLQSNAPPLIREMIRAARLAQVGPMASVAGALAEYVGTDLLKYTTQVIVENGGDIFLKVSRRPAFPGYHRASPGSGPICAIG